MIIDSAWSILKEAKRRVVLANLKKKDVYNKSELLSYFLTGLLKEYH